MLDDAELDGLTAEAWREARRGALSNFLFTIFNMGTAPNALREADLILEMLDALSARQQLALPVQDADLREKARLTLLDRLHGWQDNPDAYQTEGEWAAQTIFEVLAVLHPAQDEAES